MLFKYDVDIKAAHSQGAPCPAINAIYIAQSFTAYRLVNNPLSAGDFLPPAMMDNKGRLKIGKRPVTCAAYALSYFETYEQAQSKRCQLVAIYGPDTKIGDHIAVSSIDPNDGLRTPPNKHGHFDLYEEQNTALEKKSSVNGKAHCG